MDTMIKRKYLKAKSPKDNRLVSFQAPKELIARLQKAGINVSEVCRDALKGVDRELKTGGLKK
jgi:hypothetical protein